MIRASGSFEPDEGGMRRHLTGPQSAMVRLLRETTRQTVNSAKLRSPVDTGGLRNSIRAEPITVTGLTARTTVVADKDYAAAIHEGTGPRIIRPRNRKALVFKAGDKTVFVKEVKHPGTQPRPFLFNAARDVAGPKGFIVGRE